MIDKKTRSQHSDQSKSEYIPGVPPYAIAYTMAFLLLVPAMLYFFRWVAATAAETLELSTSSVPALPSSVANAAPLLSLGGVSGLFLAAFLRNQFRQNYDPEWLDIWTAAWVPSLFVTTVGALCVATFIYAGNGPDSFLGAIGYGGAAVFIVCGVGFMPPIRRRWKPTLLRGAVLVLGPLIAALATWLVL